MNGGFVSARVFQKYIQLRVERLAHCIFSNLLGSQIWCMSLYDGIKTVDYGEPMRLGDCFENPPGRRCRTIGGIVAFQRQYHQPGRLLRLQ